MVAQMIAPRRSVLVVVDVQNDFCHEAGVLGRAGHDMTAIQAAVDRLLGLVEAARRAGVPIIWVRTQHDGWTNSAVWLSQRAKEHRRIGDLVQETVEKAYAVEREASNLLEQAKRRVEEFVEQEAG